MADQATLRPATSRDVEPLTALIRAAYARYDGAGIALPDVAGGLAEDITRHTVWVATDAGQVIGGLVLSIAPAAHLMNIAVDPDRAGRGLGGQLLAKAETLALDAGHSRIALTTHQSLTAAQAFYRAKGWVETGRDGDRVFMAKTLA